MAKLCKIMAVIMLIGGIIGSLILAGTIHVLFVQRTGKYSIDSYTEAYNIEYATMGIGGSIAVFTVLYSFGALVEHVQRIDENLSKLVASQRRNKAADADSPKKPINTGTPKVGSWRCQYCGYLNQIEAGRTRCKSCDKERGNPHGRA